MSRGWRSSSRRCVRSGWGSAAAVSSWAPGSPTSSRRGRSPAGGEGLGIVDFEIFPHLDNPDLPQNTTADAERWASGLAGTGYAIDDETAIKVVDGAVEVVSEGHWRLFER